MTDVDQIRIAFDEGSLTTLRIMLALILLGVALDTRVSDFTRALRRPWAIIVVVFAQFLVLPGITLLLTFALDLRGSLALGLILVALSVVSDTPANIALLALAIVATFVMMLALGMATAGLTSSAERAQITTLPISLGVVATAIWVAASGTESLTLLKRLLPGGAATELVVHAWDGGFPIGDSLLLLAPTVAWVGGAVVLATRFFRWEPRR